MAITLLTSRLAAHPTCRLPKYTSCGLQHRCRYRTCSPVGVVWVSPYILSLSVLQVQTADHRYIYFRLSRKDRQNLHSCLPLTLDRMTANLTAEKFASTAFDYVVIGGGTAGLVVAARYVCRWFDSVSSI